MKQYDLIIIGGGSAGLAAAIEARKNGVESILLLERDAELGGILLQCIHNGFGLKVFKEELTGPEYAERFIEELRGMNIEYKLNSMVTTLKPDKTIQYANANEGFVIVKGKAVILTMGCYERSAGAINIPGNRPSGVLTAGTAQKYLNIDGYLVGKRVFILGSGDIGLIMARRMSLEGAKVLGVAEILPYSSGLQRNIVQCLDDYNIPLYLNHTVTEIIGESKLSKVVISKVDGFTKIKGTEKEFEVDTLLLSVGLIPENGLSESCGIELDPRTKGPIVDESYQTSVEGIFACGNVLHVHDLVDYVTSEAKKAGYKAAEYVRKKLVNGESFRTIAGEGISYVIPQMINKDNLVDNVELFMRVRKVYRDANIIIKGDNKVIKIIKKKHLAPAEMEIVKLKVDDFKNISKNLSIEVEV
ncbi:FAD-dependent oxidoreductase [Mycoplasmatota bacterium]|nr:FAD-dependent oxidoreductase [Mycoplasmatota bacterium]